MQQILQGFCCTRGQVVLSSRGTRSLDGIWWKCLLAPPGAQLAAAGTDSTLATAGKYNLAFLSFIHSVLMETEL